MQHHKYQFHEYSNLFPLLEGEEFQQLVKDIKKNGLIETIKLYEGKILDGRNRYRACLEAHIEPRFKDYVGDDPLAYVLSRNLNRRHLSTGQRAKLGLELEKIYADQARKKESKRKKNPHPERDTSTILNSVLSSDPRSAAKAAREAGTSRDSIVTMKRIVKNAPDLVEQVNDNKLSLHAAEMKLNKRENKDMPSRRLKRTKKINIQCPLCFQKTSVVVADIIHNCSDCEQSFVFGSLERVKEEFETSLTGRE